MGKRFDVLAAALLFDPLGISDVTWGHGFPTETRRLPQSASDE
jgi:hypothetical protein